MVFLADTKSSQIPPPPPSGPADMTLAFADVPRYTAGKPVDVVDVWTGEKHAGLTTSYVAKGVPLHGTAFLTLEW